MMDELKITLSPEADQNPKETVECLISAASAIFSKTENDFEEIKNTKWYKRLWKLITFSKDNEKKLANGVSSVAKLQEIIMKALLLLADKSADISDFLCKHDEEIVRISKNQASLAKNQSDISDEIERLITGAKKTISLYDIEGEKRKIFMTAFCSVVDLLNIELDHCSDYYNQIYYALGCTDAQSSVRLNSVNDTLNTEEQLLLYRVIMEYVFLATNSFECKAEILDYLAVSPTDIKATKAYITAQVKRGRKENLLLKYKSEYDVNLYTLVDDDDIDWNFDDEDHVATVLNETQKKEHCEIILDEIMHIGAGEACTYKKSKIDLKATIECEGELFFDDCDIVVDDEALKSSIELIGNGAIIFDNCRIFMYYKLSDFLISAAKNTSIRLQNCFLNGCGMFIETTGNCEIDSCRFVQPGVNLVSCKSNDDSQCVVKNSVFYQRYYPSHIKYSGKEEYASILDGISAIDNCKIERESDCFSQSNYGRKMAFINSKKVDVRHVTFKNWTNCIKSNGDKEIIVKLSTFEQCDNVISAACLDAENCNFYDCSNPIKTSGKSVVSHCQFHNCCGNSITSTSRIDIKYCLFDNCKADKCPEEQELRDHIIPAYTLYSIDDPEIKDFCENAIIHISHNKHEKTHSQILKCRFSNIDLGSTYIIKGNDYVEHKNEVVNVADCSFSNCKSSRKDKKIVRTASLRRDPMVSPLGTGLSFLIAKKKINTYTNIRLVNCNGICSNTGVIANDSGCADEFVVRTHTASKEKIGCHLEEE